MIITRVVLNEADLDRRVKAVARKLAPDVVRIRYEIALDSTDKEAIYFRILLSDGASREKRRRDVTKRVESELSKRLKLDDLGLMWYPSFRSESEQAMLKEPAWS
ncbi:MAG: hypothetical protein ABSH32_09410 [Bryobacteraceae bacterium]|jgi:hypothetical protein